MSAWLCTDTHISALVQECIVRGIIEPSKGDELWQRMKHDNLWALHCRYDDEAPPSWDEIELNRETVEAPLYGPAIYAHASCFRYQCAEFDGWDDTWSSRMAHELLKQIGEEWDLPGSQIMALADERFGHCWGIDSWDDVIDRSPSTTTTI